MTSIYLAGKIGKNDWRHDIVGHQLRYAWPNDCYVYDPTEPWPILPKAVAGTFDYVGPYFVGDDHGCGHGPNTHGAGRDGEVCGLGGDSAPPRSAIRDRCLAAIDGADLVFAWLDDPTAYGTLAEVGYARGRGKDIVIAAPELPGTFGSWSGHGWHSPDSPTADLWFAFYLGRQLQAATPKQALEKLAEEYPQLDSPIEIAFWRAYIRAKPAQLKGLKTQHSVLGRYRLDFALPEQKIGIELDGYEWHSSREAFTKDRERQRNLELDGWRIIRFSGAEINGDAERCVKQAATLVDRFASGTGAAEPTTQTVFRQPSAWPAAASPAATPVPASQPGAWPTANGSTKGPEA